MGWQCYQQRNAFPPYGCGWNDSAMGPSGKTEMTVEEVKAVCEKDPYCHGFVYEPKTKRYWKVRDLEPSEFYTGNGKQYDVYVRDNVPTNPHLFRPSQISEAVQHFTDFGFVVVAEAFDEEVLAKATEVVGELKANCRKRDANRGLKRYEVGSITHKALNLQGVFASPVVLSFLKELYQSDDITVQCTNGIVSFPGCDCQPLHIDCRRDPDQLRMKIPPATKMYAPLVDMTETVGPTRFIPGSHLCTMRGELPYHKHKEQLEGGTVLATCPRGAAVFMDMRVWHGGCMNRSKCARPILGVHYGKSDFKGRDYNSVWFDNHKALPQQTFQQLGKGPQKILRRVVKQ